MADKFYLGSFSPEGFRGSFSGLIGSEEYKTVILKGGAGTGKSSLMKRIAKHFEDTGSVSVYYCSSDPNSLDAVVVGDAKRIVVDGTAPHVFDPVYPGARQKILNLGEFWDEEALRDSEDIIVSITDEHKKLMERTKRYVQALSSIFSDTYSIAADSLLNDKLKSFTERFFRKLAPKRSQKAGKLCFRQLSALTPDGYVTFSETLKDYEVYIIRDPFFAGSDALLKELASDFTSRGEEVWVSLCNMFSQPVYQHLIVPHMKLAFVTSDPLTGLVMDSAKPVNMLRFYDKELIAQKKYRLKLNKNACADLTEEAAKTMKAALKTHDRLEKLYISAMNFAYVDRAAEELINSIERELT